MEKPKRNILWFLLAVTAVSTLGWFISVFTPSTPASLILFFILVWATIFFAVGFITRNIILAILSAIGISVWLILRLFGLREIYYVVLLALILISLEILLSKE